MSSTLLELTRAAHEDLERYERVLVQKLANKAKTHRETIYQQHRMNNVLIKAQEKAKTLLDIYEDKDGLRRDEIASLGGQNVFGAFYDRLKEIKDYHRKFPSLSADNADDITPDEDDNVPAEVKFTGQEGYGRYFDLHYFHERFLNLTNFQKMMKMKRERMDYITYLEHFDKFADIPCATKNKEFKAYLQELFEYLKGFHERMQPLANLGKTLSKLENDFEERWKKGQILGWEKVKKAAAPAATPAAKEGAAGNGTAAEGDKEGKEDTEMAEANGKPDDSSAPLYCAACKKVFAKDTVFEAHLKGKKHLKAAKNADSNGTADGSEIDAAAAALSRKEAGQKSIALLEAKIERMTELLAEQAYNTKINVQKKQSRTYEEIEAEMEDGEEPDVDVADSDSDEEKPIYNPLNLPLGWDGKPIPYWLYKLHGLGIEFKCEICGNYSYWGPRAFERHFQEWRHAHGMRCLKIPNTRHFQNITLIEDALALYEKIKVQANQLAFKPELEEEYEDTGGNVFNRKTFEDLKRQGLL